MQREETFKKKKKKPVWEDEKCWRELPALPATPLDAPFNHSGTNAGSLFFLAGSLPSITITDHDKKEYACCSEFGYQTPFTFQYSTFNLLYKSLQTKTKNPVLFFPKRIIISAWHV